MRAALTMPTTILLPTLNEEQAVGGVIDKIEKVGKGEWKIVVVDSGSTDRTLDIVKKKGVRLISVPTKGKGTAVKKAFGNIDSDFLVLIDSDASYFVEDIPKILEKLKECDVVVGSRFKGKIDKNAMSRINWLGNVCLREIASVFYERKISDVCSGMWGFNKKAYRVMDIDASGFELEANFFVESVRKKLGLGEVPISYKMREGKTKISVFDGLKIGFYLIKKKVW